MGSWAFVLAFLLLFGAEEAVACVAETGENVAMLVQATVKGGNVDVYVRMGFRNLGNALGRTDDRHELNVLAALILQELNSVACASARCKHGVNDENQLVLNSLGKLTVVGLGNQRFFISVHTDMANLGRGEENVYTVYHAESGTENGHDYKRIVLYDRLCAGLKRSFNLDLYRGNATL